MIGQEAGADNTHIGATKNACKREQFEYFLKSVNQYFICVEILI
jgi:hypothetical protein